MSLAPALVASKFSAFSFHGDDPAALSIDPLPTFTPPGVRFGFRRAMEALKAKCQLTTPSRQAQQAARHLSRAQGCAWLTSSLEGGPGKILKRNAAAVPLVPDDVVASETRGEPSASSSNVAVNFETPTGDHREYEYLELKNGLKLILVSDKNCDTAAASMCLRVGSALDPEELPGLANLLLLIRYPAGNDWDKFIRKHGGDLNAALTMKNTAYYFVIPSGHLEGAIDRFAQMFKPPSLTPIAIDRNIQDLESAFLCDKPLDAYRLKHLKRHLLNPKHLASRFTNGNITTLRERPREKGINVQDALIAYYEKYYSANQMTLCVVGRESIADLKRMVVQRFEAIRNNGIVTPKDGDLCPGEPLYSPEDPTMLVEADSLSDDRSINFSWQIPSQTDLWESKPTSYIGHCLGHEGSGSLLSALKKEGLATSLVAGCSSSGGGRSDCFNVGISLTEKGATEKGVLRVGQIVHGAVGLLQASEVRRDLHEELEKSTRQAFSFSKHTSPLSLALFISKSLVLYPPSKVISGPQRIYKLNSEGIADCLRCMTADNLRVVICRKGIKPADDGEKQESISGSPQSRSTSPSRPFGEWKTEPYYGTQYRCTPLEKKTIDLWESERLRWTVMKLSRGMTDPQCNTAGGAVQPSGPPTDYVVRLPQPNPFLPEDFSLKPKPEGESRQLQLLKRSSGAHFPSRIYFKQDVEYNTPHFVCNFRISCPYMTGGVKEFMLSYLYFSTVNELLNQTLYDAQTAGMWCGVLSAGSAAAGFDISVGGYNDKGLLLLKTLAERIRNPGLTLEAFRVVYDDLKLLLQNELKISQASEEAYEYRRRALNTPYYSAEDRLKALSNIHFEDLQSLLEVNNEGAVVKNALLDNLFVEGLIQGNVTEKEAHELVDTLEDSLRVRATRDGANRNVRDNRGRVLDLRKLQGAIPNEPARYRIAKCSSNPNDSNNATLLTIQAEGAGDTVEEGLLELAMNFLEPLFHFHLRRQRHLGYEMHIRANEELRFCYIDFVIASPHVSAAELTKRIEAFLEVYLEQPSLTEEQFQQLRSAAISRLEIKPISMYGDATRNIEEIENRRFKFGRREAAADYLKSATREDLLQFLSKLRKAPWIVAEVSSQTTSPSGGSELQSSQMEAVKETSESDAVEVPALPSTPQKYVDVTNGFPVPLDDEHYCILPKASVPKDQAC